MAEDYKNGARFEKAAGDSKAQRPRPGDEAVHEQADPVRASRDLQLPADLLHWRECQKAARHHWRPQQLRI